MKQILVNALGAIGYVFVAIQWMWAFIIVVIPLASHPFFMELFMPSSRPASEPLIGLGPMPELAQSVVMVFSVIMSLGIIIYVAIKAPAVVGRTGQRMTRKVATKALPVITHRKKITKKRKKSLLERLTWSIKAGMVVMPALALAVPPGDIIDLNHDASIVFGLALASVSAIYFGLQFIFAKLWAIDANRVW